MSATYSRVSRLVPSAQRAGVITGVVATDTINFEDVLGRPARRIKIVPDDATDSISIRLNNRIRFTPIYTAQGTGEVGHPKPDSTYVVSEGSHYPLYTLTGAAEYYTEEGLSVAFLQIDAITFGSGGTAITVYCW